MKSSVYFQSPAIVEQFRPVPTELAAQCMANDRARYQKVGNNILDESCSQADYGKVGGVR